MSTPDGNIFESLAKEPFSFDFYRAVRLLENLRRDLPRIGYSRSLAEDPIRFGQNPHLTFAPSTIEAFHPGTVQSAPVQSSTVPSDSTIQRGNDTTVPRLLIRFFGLFGPNAPLPPHVTEYARERQLNYGDRTIAAFCNIFHHRLISFFYRAWSANQKAVDLDRLGSWERPSDSPRFAAFIGGFFGIGAEALQQRDAVPDWAKLFFSGRLSCQTRNAEGLESILQAYFEIKTNIQTFFGRWLDLPPDSICKLGESPETGSLGVTSIVGTQMWDCQLSFRIRLGPMKLADYERMLPAGESFKRLRSWVLNYCGHHYSWDVQLVLEATEVPQTTLGRSGQLGWTTWLLTETPTRDADDLVLMAPDD